MATTNKPAARSTWAAPDVHQGCRSPWCWLRGHGLLIWYAGGAERAGAIERVLEPPPNGVDLAGPGATTWNMERPVLPAPHQVAPTSGQPDRLAAGFAAQPAVPRGGDRAEPRWWALSGHAAGPGAGGADRALRTLDRALLPWIVASQTVPVLAIAPIVLVILGSLGLRAWRPRR
jgi:NitT/TauT family transport system permease protein